jgi:hypothetical protein
MPFIYKYAVFPVSINDSVIQAWKLQHHFQERILIYGPCGGF